MRIVLLCVCCVCAPVRLAFGQCPDGTPPPCAPRTSARTSAPARFSVAVLYFENLSRDTSDAYLADGLTDELTARLGQISRLVVTSRAAVHVLRTSAASLSLAQLGRTLNAAYLVSGSSRRSGPRVRVTVELVRAATGERVWGEQYDRENTDLLTLQEEIARAVATGIAGRLLPAEQRSLTARPTRDPEAFDHYLRGNRLLWTETESAVLGAIHEYEASLGRDPGFTAARGRLAYAYGLVLNYAYLSGGLPTDSVLARGVAAADRAIAEDSSVADAWLGRGTLLLFRGRSADFELGSEALRRAVVLDPGSDASHHWYAVALRRLGHFDDAEQEYRRALAVNPARMQSVNDLGFIAMSRRQYPVALQWYDRGVELDSSFAMGYGQRARARLALGDRSGALDDAATALRVANQSERARMLAVVAEMTFRAGDSAGARLRFQEALRDLGWSPAGPAAPIGVRNAYDPALAAVALGDMDLALTILERVRPRGPWLWSYLVWDGFDLLRADPRFRAVYLEARPPGAPDPP